MSQILRGYNVSLLFRKVEVTFSYSTLSNLMVQKSVEWKVMMAIERE